ncbi:MAG: TetR/AcrR family transcriptional regulator [Pacificibacter sp.]|uniref:TetR/AcrR family transcriptional regulator n=1 Tax=Pacificibacter sp. TaxID=1917866 RepID=UPI00321A52A8
MRDDKRQMRHDAITQAAYALLAEKGYDGTSMLSIAKAAKASNETLYRWYGDKRGLFEAMVRDNAAEVKTMLEAEMSSGGSPIDALRTIAPVLLSMLLGERAILLNRAAASDPSGELGAAIAKGGRDAVQPQIAAVIEDIETEVKPQGMSKADLFLGLLIGDAQIRRVLGVMPALPEDQIQARSNAAIAAFLKVLSVG